ncbi:MAG: hypothetical protein V1744_06370 [Candidatus Altiarchaeota archaeon]
MPEIVSRKPITEDTKEPLLYGPRGEVLKYYGKRPTVWDETVRAHIDSIESPTVKFTDLIGQHQAKAAFGEIIQILNLSDEERRNQGVELPRAVLIFGWDSTGKGHASDCFAGEVGAKQLKVELVELRDIHKQWGKDGLNDLLQAFSETGGTKMLVIRGIKELDGDGISLNELLRETSRLSTSKSILPVFIADTTEINPEEIYPSLADYWVAMKIPDEDERKEILHTLATTKPTEKEANPRLKLLSTGITIDELARRTSNMSYAEIKQLLSTAENIARYAAGQSTTQESATQSTTEATTPKKDEAITIKKEHLEKAFQRTFEAEGTKFMQRPYDRITTVYHELGHAFAQKYLEHVPSPKIITFTGVTMLGYTAPEGDERQHLSLNQVIEEIACSYGGYVAEELMLPKGERGTGVSEDFRMIDTLVTASALEAGFGSDNVTLKPIPTSHNLGSSSEANKQLEAMTRKLKEQGLDKMWEVFDKYEYEFLYVSDKVIEKEITELSLEDFNRMLTEAGKEKQDMEKQERLPEAIRELQQKHNTRTNEAYEKYKKRMK